MGKAEPTYEEFSKTLEGLSEAQVEYKLEEGQFGRSDAREYLYANRWLREKNLKRAENAGSRADEAIEIARRSAWAAIASAVAAAIGILVTIAIAYFKKG